MTAAVDEITSTLGKLWAEALEVPQVAEDADFFALGGDSMAAIRMLTAVLDRYDVDIDLERFFAEPTIRVLRALISRAADEPC